MAEVLECTQCGKVFSEEETVKKHAKRVHKTSNIVEESKLFDLG
jgi:uncharacterized C2H2 Zn-finger protein